MKDKREKFIHLAEKRVIRTLRELRLIGNLANRNNYSYTEQDAQKIISALESELKSLKTRFFSEGGRGNPIFKL